VSDLSYTVVEAPRVAPPRVGLLASAEEVLDETRWTTGLAFDRMACGTFGGTHFACAPDGSEAPPKTIEPESHLVTYFPYTAWYGDRCSSATFQSRDFSGRASSAYAAAESAIMANELWTGTVAQVAGLPNAYLASSDADPIGTFSLTLSLARLQQEMADLSPGRGMVHAPRDIASLWLDSGIIRREGALLLDAFDNIVVADSGYPGTGPEGQERTETTAWVYATDLVQVRRDGQIRMLPSTDEAMGGAALDRDTNTIEWRAERIVAAYFPGCVHLAVSVDLCAQDCD
jgi:hypothetical protein